MAGSTEEIVWVETEDGIRHDGVVVRPTGAPTGTVVVWMHGFTGHFSEPHQIQIGRTAEPEIGSPADLEMVKRNARSSSHVETALIEGADHVYTTSAEDVARAIEGFLGRLA